MQHLRANTEVKVVIGPFVDNTDGLTPETGITLGAADEAELMKHNAASNGVTDIAAATWAAVTGMDGYYVLTLTTALTDTEGMMTIAVQDDDVCLPVKAQFMVLAEAAYDSMYVAKDDGYMDVNVKTQDNIDFGATQKASINSEVVDAIGVDTVDEMSQGDPPASATIKQMLNYLYRKLRNKNETTSTVCTVYDDAGTTALFKETHSDDGTTFTKGKYVTGA